MEYPRRRVDSLVALCVNYVVTNISKYQNDFNSLKLLPPRIKDRMLHKFTSSSFFWSNINFKQALSSLIHPMTKRIDLSLANVDDEILKILCESRNFTYVYLTRDANDCLNSQGILEFISSLKYLEVLQIPHCTAVNDDVLISLSKNCPALTALDVCGCMNVTDVALEAMSNMKNLVWLTFSSTQVSNKGIETLTSGASGLNIKELRLANCKYITGDILQTIIQYCPNMEVLVFYNLQPSDNSYQTYFPFNEGGLKNLKQLTWTVQW